MSALIDERWESIVRPQFDDLVRVLNPDSFLDRLFCDRLVTKEEFQRLRSISSSREEKSRALLCDILPRKGPTSYNRFVSILKESEGQEHVAKALGGETRSREREGGRVKELEKKLAKSELTNIGLRKKIEQWDGGYLKWKETKPSILIDYPCEPVGRVAEINGMIQVGEGDTMHQLNEGVWEGKDHHLGVRIRSVFECEDKGYVMDFACKSIYEWQSEERDLELLTKIPDQCQLNNRAATGHNRNIYLVGGWQSNRIDCFDIISGEWKPINKMQNERLSCSLAVIDDKMFVGGGFGAGKSVECLSMKEEKWINIKPTAKKLCQLSSWNGKLVATGGLYKSNSVEMYDELSGEWLSLPSMNKGRSSHGVCTTKDKQLVVVGGFGAENSVECLKL